MNAIEEERFNTLIEFLEALAPEKFDFLAEVEQHKNLCGTVCCAIGWTPAVFPDLVTWYNYATQDDLERGRTELLSVKASNGHTGFKQVAQFLFGLNELHAECLFYPGSQYRLSRFLPICNQLATPQQVAVMLRKYLELVHNGHLIP